MDIINKDKGLTTAMKRQSESQLKCLTIHRPNIEPSKSRTESPNINSVNHIALQLSTYINWNEIMGIDILLF